MKKSYNELIILCNDWYYDYKGSLKEIIKNLINEYEIDIKKSLEIIIFEYFPIWINENIEDIKLLEYNKRLKEIYFKI